MGVLTNLPMLLVGALMVAPSGAAVKSIAVGDTTIAIPLTVAVLGASNCLKKDCDDLGLRYVLAAIQLASAEIGDIASANLTDVDNSTISDSLQYFNPLKTTLVNNQNGNPVAAAASAAKTAELSLVLGVSKSCSIEVSATAYYDKLTLPGSALCLLLQKFGWKNVGMIGPLSLDQFYSNVRTLLGTALTGCGVSQLLESRYDLTTSTAKISAKIVQDLQAARIFVAIDPTGQTCRHFLLTLVQEGKHATGDYFLLCYLQYNLVRAWIDQPDVAVMMGNENCITGARDYIDFSGFATGALNIYSIANYTIPTDGANQWGIWPIGGISVKADNDTALPRDRWFIIVICGAVAFICVLITIAALLYRRYRFERRLHSLAFLIDRKDIILKRHVNILSTRSLRSIHDFKDSFVGHDAKGSHFLIGEYGSGGPGGQGGFRRDSKMSHPGSVVGPAPMDVFGEILDAGPIKEHEDPLDARWSNIDGFAVGMHEGSLVGLKRVWKDDVELTREIRKEIIQIQECSHENLLAMKGLMLHTPNVFIVTEMANRGSLKEILDSDQLQLEPAFFYQMSKDIVTGLEFLHSSALGCHGRLKSTNCLIDSRWMVKLSSFGLRQLRDNEEDNEAWDQSQLWTAPELLRWSTNLSQYSSLLLAKADIYSLAIILYEIFGRAGPWGDEPLSSSDIVSRLKNHDNGGDKKPFRPDMATIKEAPQMVREMVSAGWAEDPLSRPTATQYKKKLRVLTSGMWVSLMCKYAVWRRDFKVPLKW
ncbi:unnamed protein product, partial [Mesorhabditis spiculigera]